MRRFWQVAYCVSLAAAFAAAMAGFIANRAAGQNLTSESIPLMVGVVISTVGFGGERLAVRLGLADPWRLRVYPQVIPGSRESRYGAVAGFVCSAALCLFFSGGRYGIAWFVPTMAIVSCWAFIGSRLGRNWGYLFDAWFGGIPHEDNQRNRDQQD